ncbi:putative secreted protein with PEP-CTERM sorting signal [Nitrosospira sp. Nsp2]|uniref:CHRD domain-containing protein n=1 Tax=Nitrosospira sp. Nsp2 TaxID=136548 RepID=UPI000D4E289A|nr:CHRD domain-containing protein [Nitrosospira sp. Nsp2]PTR16470.1 putative secreted protein with PEP-CTERM sorting signal [Nitrosospira sp. Nsp2]
MKYSSLVAGFLFAALALPAAAQSVYTTVLRGSAEEPANESPATGTATVTVDTTNFTMRVEETFSGLVAGNTASHIHCCTATPLAGNVGVATTTPTFTGFPTGTTSGVYDHTFDMTDPSSYNPSFITDHGGTASGAFDALVAGLNSGSAYANIHSSTFQAGEIRGFLTLVPEPESYAMLLAGLGIISILARRRRV